MAGDIAKHSIAIDGHRTSVSLEPEFWQALKAIATRRAITLNSLVSEIDRARKGNLSSALRVYVLNDLLARSREAER